MEAEASSLNCRENYLKQICIEANTGDTAVWVALISGLNYLFPEKRL